MRARLWSIPVANHN